MIIFVVWYGIFCGFSSGFFQETFCWIGNKVYLCAPLKAAERRWVRSERKKFEKKFGRMEITLTFALRYKKG